LKTGPNVFLQHFKNKISFNFVKFVTPKKGMTTNFTLITLFLLRFLDLGSGIRDPGSEIRDPRSGIRDPGFGMGKKSGSGINIPNPQHWFRASMTTVASFK
jgi:hypothetical protein